jgi:hypothetical protein
VVDRIGFSGFMDFEKVKPNHRSYLNGDGQYKTIKTWQLLNINTLYMMVPAHT